jgi:NAD(P)-dependent dehydrogenase (short-subunit alcohol dehydrogenase family)
MKPKRLILACRDMKTGAAALESVLSKYPGTNATVWNLDLASFENIKEFAARANKELDVVDVAVLNAA